MIEWRYARTYPSGETPSPRTGYRWRYSGEVTLSLSCNRLSLGSPTGRFEAARIFDNPTVARLMASPHEREAAIAATTRGETFVEEPFWRGNSPKELEEFCREHRLPLPSGYKRRWRSFQSKLK